MTTIIPPKKRMAPRTRLEVTTVKVIPISAVVKGPMKTATANVKSKQTSPNNTPVAYSIPQATGIAIRSIHSRGVTFFTVISTICLFIEYPFFRGSKISANTKINIPKKLKP